MHWYTSTVNKQTKLLFSSYRSFRTIRQDWIIHFSQWTVVQSFCAFYAWRIKQDNGCIFVFLAECDEVLLESPRPSSQGAPLLVSASGEEMRTDLQGSDLWKRFHEIGTEMIITKAGRWDEKQL